MITGTRGCGSTAGSRCGGRRRTCGRRRRGTSLRKWGRSEFVDTGAGSRGTLTPALSRRTGRGGRKGRRWGVAVEVEGDAVRVSGAVFPADAGVLRLPADLRDG